MTKWKIYNEDAIEWAKHYDKAKFHALLCDPPYHLSSIVKRFGKNGSAPAKYGTDGVFSRASSGFMGKTWDGGDIAFQPETWAAFSNVLHPGAFIMAFAASRNWHRLAVAIEDAGFIIHPTIFGWAYGSGFPKATRIKSSKTCPTCDGIGRIRTTYTYDKDAETDDASWESFEWQEEVCPTCGGKKRIGDEKTDNVFAGHRYGLQALKPALEPIIVAQFPYDGKPVENIVRTGAGALNIEASRIPGPAWTWGTQTDIRGGGYDSKRPSDGDVYAHNVESNPSGRWPANFYLDAEAARRLDLQSGITTSSGGKSGHTGAYQGGFKEEYYGDMKPGLGDTGGASRFFFRVAETLDEADPVRYCAKSSRSERDAGLEGMPLVERRTHGDMGVDETGASHNTTGQKPAIGHNVHPTVKPLALAKYLATLLLPPVEYAPRRIFVPFCGVASEMIGAGQAGWEHIVGVESDTESNYVGIAQARLEHYLNHD